MDLENKVINFVPILKIMYPYAPITLPIQLTQHYALKYDGVCITL